MLGRSPWDAGGTAQLHLTAITDILLTSALPRKLLSKPETELQLWFVSVLQFSVSASLLLHIEKQVGKASTLPPLDHTLVF